MITLKSVVRTYKETGKIRAVPITVTIPDDYWLSKIRRFTWCCGVSEVGGFDALGVISIQLSSITNYIASAADRLAVYEMLCSAYGIPFTPNDEITNHSLLLNVIMKKNPTVEPAVITLSTNALYDAEIHKQLVDAILEKATVMLGIQGVLIAVITDKEFISYPHLNDYFVKKRGWEFIKTTLHRGTGNTLNIYFKTRTDIK